MEPNEKYDNKTEDTELDVTVNQTISEMNNEAVNGFLIKDKYIPEESLAEIFKHVNNKTLLLCHLVCKQWCKLLKDYVWRKKAEYVTRRKFPVDKTVPWTSYYYLCDNRPFGRNLVYSKVVLPHTDRFSTLTQFERGEDVPVNITPFPDDDTFHGKCIITALEHTYSNKYVIDLVQEGFTEHILDKVQPIVKVCEWHAIDNEIGLTWYNCSYKLVRLEKDDDDKDKDSVMRIFHYAKKVDKVGQWIKFTHSFQNYGEGLRKIKFYHSASDGVVMVGASVTLEINMYHNIGNRKISPFVGSN